MIDYDIARIISGYVIYRRPHLSLLIKQPSEFYKMRAAELWQDIYTDQLSDESGMDSEQYHDFIISRKLWDNKREEKLESLPKDLEELKLKYFQSDFNASETGTVKKLIGKIKDDIQKLYLEKNSHYYLTAKGIADSFKSKYLLAMSIYKINNKRLFENEAEYLDNNFSYFDDVYSYYCKTRLDEENIRRICRSNEWKAIWSCSKSGNPFGKPPVKLTDEQRSVIGWSKLYDNISKHPDKPDPTVIEDDDMLDGWMIFQRRKSEEEIKQKKFEDSMSERIKGAEELFVQVNSQEEANRLYAMNSQEAKVTLAKRNKVIAEKGVASEFDLPDIKVKKRLAFMKRRSELENR